MKNQLNEYIIQHQSKKLEPAGKENESDLMVETILVSYFKKGGQYE